MAIYRFPPDYHRNQDASKERENPPFEGKLPDYIYIGDEPDPSANAEGVGDDQPSRSSKQSMANSYPLFFRFSTLVCGVVFTIWASVLAVATLVAVCANIILFWRPTDMADKARSFWKRTCKMSALALAFFVATLSPAFGFAIAALYFAQRGEKKPAFFGRFF